MVQYTRKQYFKSTIKPYIHHAYEYKILMQRFGEFETGWCRTSSGINMPMTYVTPKLIWRVIGGVPRWAPARPQHENMWNNVCRYLHWNPRKNGELQDKAAKIQAAFRAWKWRREVLWNPNTEVGQRYIRYQFVSFQSDRCFKEICDVKS